MSKWAISIDRKAEREFAKIDAANRGRILRFLSDRLANAHDPRSIGQALAGSLSGYWKYRVGDFRIIAHIQDETVTILIVRMGHRREIYR